MLRPFPRLAENRYFIWGIARSGIHAIAQWLYDAHPDHRLYLISQTYGREPTSSWEPKSPLADLHVSHDRREQLVCSGRWPEDYTSTASVLVVTLENHDLSCYRGDDWTRDTLLGESRNTWHVLLIRNLFNHYASYVTASQAHGGLQCYIRNASSCFKNLNNFPIDLWKMQAREYFRISNYFPNAIRLHYDLWVSSPSYRSDIARQLGYDSDGEAYQKVPSNGGGSSFDKLKYNGSASEMKVLDRWGMIDPSDQAKLLSGIDEETVWLAERLTSEFKSVGC